MHGVTSRLCISTRIEQRRVFQPANREGAIRRREVLDACRSGSGGARNMDWREQNGQVLCASQLQRDDLPVPDGGHLQRPYIEGLPRKQP